MAVGDRRSGHGADGSDAGRGEPFRWIGLAGACANYLLLDERRSQAPFMALTYFAAREPKVAEAESWVREKFGRDFGVNELAEAVGLSPRTFARGVSQSCKSYIAVYLESLGIYILGIIGLDFLT